MPIITRRSFLLVPRFGSDEGGATAIEYALIAALLCLIGIGAFSHVSKNIETSFANLGDILVTSGDPVAGESVKEKKTSKVKRERVAKKSNLKRVGD